MNQAEVITLGGGNNKDTNFEIEESQIVNKSHEFNFLLSTIPVCIMAIFINTIVLKILLKEEKTIVNQLMMLDSIVSIAATFLGTFQQSPYFRGLGVQGYCYPHLVAVVASITFNRLLPVSIVVFRYT